jgi:hypothetical protein
MPSPTPVPIAALLLTPIAVTPSEPVRPSPPSSADRGAPLSADRRANSSADHGGYPRSSADRRPLLPIAAHPRGPTSPCQGSDLSALDPSFHPRLQGKLSVVAKLPRGVNLAVPAKEPNRDPMSRISTSQETCSEARVELHRLVARSSAAYEASSSWEEFIAHCKDPQGDLQPAIKTLPHRAAHLLDNLRRTGATVAMKTEPWSRQRKVEALKRGLP